MDKQINIRTLNSDSLQVRSLDDGAKQISGYALTFNEPSKPMPFIEYIQPEALDGVDLSQVLLLYGHEYNNILARADSGTLETALDKKGLFFRATLTNTQLANDVYADIEAGNVKGCSFGFQLPDVGGDQWVTDDAGNTVHIITQIKAISEISLTPLPAYTETSVQIERDYQKFLKGEQKRMANQPEDTQQAPQAKPAQGTDTQALAELVKALSEKVDSLTKPADSGSDAKQSDAPASDDAEQRDDDTPEIQDDATDKTAEEPTKPAKSDEPAPATEPAKPAEKPAPSSSATPATAPQQQQPTDKKEGTRAMPKDITPENQKEKQEVRSFVDYLKSKGEKRDGVTTVGNEAVIPTQILNLQEQPNDPANLAQYANRQSVKAPKGDLPILQKATARLVTKAELAQNPDLASFGIKEVDYSVETLAGVLPVSYELISDGAVNIPSIVSNYVNEARALTEQEKIGAVLQKATAVTATTADDLKDAYNHDLTYYNRMIVASESAYAEIDKLKDGNGRYLFQDSITSASGKTLFGAPVVVVPDTVLGKAGESHLFIGDVKAFVLEAYKDEVTVKWTDNDIWGDKASVYLRADFQVADEKAGKFITFTPATTTTTPAK
jgi:HK97 family phage major capsid protein/HK97 family phage prohead protease